MCLTSNSIFKSARGKLTDLNVRDKILVKKKLVYTSVICTVPQILQYPAFYSSFFLFS